MKEFPMMYTNHQMEVVEQAIQDRFGPGSGAIFHEITSEYVHTDAFSVKQGTDTTVFVTCGMGAREMAAPAGRGRCELVMYADQGEEPVTPQGSKVVSELVGLSKFPFRNDTWLGQGHTLDASGKFRESFGYDCFALWERQPAAQVPGIPDKVRFLTVVPLYKEERDWCMEHHTLALLDALYELYGDRIFHPDFRRPVFFPEVDEDEGYAYTLMTLLDIDRATLDALGEALQQAEEEGHPFNYEDIERWVAQQRDP